uniref:MRH domain-containing protein n=1 Tax=Arcella intermedia TaxID=1963864 RepID=A0A6B2L9W3_9EUKA
MPFLEDLQDRCLYRLEGWWTYEFCYGKHVRQFHQDKDGTIVASFNLGLKTDASKGVAGEDFYYEKFSKGTVCDLTAQPRTCEIRYYCSPEAEVSSLSSIKEPSSCNYIIRIDTPLLCKHPEYAYTVKEATEKIFCFEAPVPALEDIEIEEADLEWKKQKEATQAANAVKEKTTTTTETTPEPATTTTTTKTKKKKKTAATVSDDAAKTTNVNQDNTKEATPTETKNTPPNVLDVSLDPIDPLKELGQTEPVNDVNEENGVKIAFLSEADLSDLIEDFNSAQDELDLKKLKQVFDGFDEVKRKPPASREDKEKKKDKKDL